MNIKRYFPVAIAVALMVVAATMATAAVTNTNWNVIQLTATTDGTGAPTDDRTIKRIRVIPTEASKTYQIKSTSSGAVLWQDTTSTPTAALIEWPTYGMADIYVPAGGVQLVTTDTTPTVFLYTSKRTDR